MRLPAPAQRPPGKLGEGVNQRFPSGLIRPLPSLDEAEGDIGAWLARVVLAMDQQPVGTTAPCVNPECNGPVDRVPGVKFTTLYCSSTCRNRTSALRRSCQQQLEVIDALLEVTKFKQRVPRQELRERAAMIRWWLARLIPIDEGGA